MASVSHASVTGCRRSSHCSEFDRSLRLTINDRSNHGRSQSRERVA